MTDFSVIHEEWDVFYPLLAGTPSSAQAPLSGDTAGTRVLLRTLLPELRNT
jgi:hypothetical protein